MMKFLIFIMFFMGNMIFVSKYKHLLTVLLSLEFIILSLYLLMLCYFTLMLIDYNMFMLMVFLVFSVCEGALGLSILVSMIRTYGNDYFQSYNLLW